MLLEKSWLGTRTQALGILYLSLVSHTAVVLEMSMCKTIYACACILLCNAHVHSSKFKKKQAHACVY